MLMRLLPSGMILSLRNNVLGLLGLVVVSCLPMCYSITPHEANHVWQLVYRARRACHASEDLCSGRFRNLDPENCLNYCLSAPCFEKVYGAEPVCSPLNNDFVVVLPLSFALSVFFFLYTNERVSQNGS